MTRLALTSLKLAAFRSHASLRVETDGRPVAIYGPNGAGKTNILEAISMLSPGRGLRRAAAADMARSATGIGWRVTAELHSLEQSHEVVTGVEGDAARSVTIDGKAAAQVALGRIARILWLVPVMDRLWLEGAGERRRFLDRMALSFTPSHAEASITYERAMRDRNRLLKDQSRDAGWYDALEDQMARAGAAITATRMEALSRVARAQEDAATAFPRATLSITGPDGEDAPDGSEDQLRRAFAEGRRRDMAAGRTLTGPHRADLSAIYTDKDMPARHCSTGEQKALLISLILANARALADSFGAPPILLLDEVAAHLDTDRRAALYDEICALGAQAWMTGTGAELFDALGPRAMRLHVTEEGGESRTQAEA
ncbi:DNA replication and repair protein RecF [Rubricella aquisinus]|uniref:DNA replication and repair protein RecF n=1 Tax=Rubricella aquisinus TaxID=2028108 RepID=A0A840X466_9RHOB|nr:DNA replication and repair protein RecF [Rubricella aquisinus]